MRRLHPVFRRLLATLIALALLLGVGVVLFTRQALTIDSGDVSGDAIVVLGGGANQLRPEKAAELFGRHKASLVLISGRGDFEACKRLLLQTGVPESAITIEPTSKSTLENAKFSIALLRRLGARRVILVTSWYHSRRALACFQQTAPDMIFYSCPSYWGYPRRDWIRLGVIGYFGYEYMKLLGYWVCYGIYPVPSASPRP